MGRLVGAGNPALDLDIVDALGQHRERLGRLIPRLHLYRRPVDGMPVKPRRRSGLEPPQRKAQAFQRQRQANGRRFSDSAGRGLVFSDMDETTQERAGGKHHRPSAKHSSVCELEAGNAVLPDDQVVGLALDDGQVSDRGNRPLHSGGVEPTIGLGARAANRRALAPVEHAELDAAEVGRRSHQAIKGINLADKMAFAETPDRRITGHCANGGKSVGDERGLGTHARGRGSRLAAGMASADDNDVVPGAHRLECLHFPACS